MNGGASDSSSSSVQTLATGGETNGATSTNGYLETVTILLIVAVLFLLIAVLVVVKNSFDKRPPYQSVDAPSVQNEGGEKELAEIVIEE